MREQRAPDTPPALRHPFKLDVFTIDPMARTFIGPADCIQVDPKVLDVLIVLALRAGSVVPRGELLDFAWKGRIVSDDALSRCVYQLRRHFCRAGGSERFKDLLETIPKRGYRLNCEFHSGDRESTIALEAAASRKSPAGTRRSAASRTTGLVVLLIVCAVLGGGLWVLKPVEIDNSVVADPVAFDLYTRANDYYGRADRQTALPYAEALYRQATEADPDFPEAWIGLVRVNTDIYWHGIDREPARLEKAQEAIDYLFNLGGDSSAAHLANANFLLKGLNRYEDALAALDEAEKYNPRNPDLYFMRAMAHRRLGDWRAAIEELDTAIAKNSLNINYLRQQYINYHFLREFDKADAILDRILALFPDDGTTYVDKAILAMCLNGDTTLAKIYEQEPPSELYDEGLAYTYAAWLAAIFDRDYEKALQILDDAPDDQIFDGDLRNVSFGPKALYYARTYRLAGNHEKARLNFIEVLQLLRNKSIGESPDTRIRVGRNMALAEARAGLGQVELALQTVRAAKALIPASDDDLISSALQIASVVRVLVPAGLTAEALQELDNYLGKVPGHWSLNGLRNDPRLAPIIDSQGFKDIETKYSR